MKRKARVAILVVGMHRSGTSAIARTVSLLGASLPGNLLAPGADENPTGFWESQDFLDCHEGFLGEVGSSWDDPLPLPEAAFAGAAAQRAHDELVVLLHRNFDQAPLFIVKDPRLCRLMPLWRRALESFGARPVAVLPVRNPLDVALSLHRRNGFSREASLALWFIHALQAERSTRGMGRVFALYDDFIEKPDTAAAALADRLGCFPPDAIGRSLPAIEAYWRDALRHHALGTEALRRDPAVPDWVRELYDWLEKAAAGQPVSAEALDAIAAALAPALQLYGPLVAAQVPLKAEVAAAREAGERTGEIVAAARAETAHAAGERDRMRIERDALRGEAAELRLEAERWRGESRLAGLDLTGLRDKLQESAERIEALNQERRRREEMQAELERKLGAAGERIVALGEERAEARAQAQAERVAADAARIETAAAHAEISVTREEADRLREESGGWRERSEDLRRALDAAALQQDRLRTELAAARQDGDGLSALLAERIAQGEAETIRHAAEMASLAARLEEADRTGRGLAFLRRQAEETIELLHQALRHRRWSDRIAILRMIRRSVEALWLWPWLRGFFDAEHYRKVRPEGAAWLPDLAHFLLVGRARDLSPTPLFDPAFYRRRYPDVALSGADPLLHYMRHGGREGRKPSPGFDGAYYLHQNPDVARKGGNPLRHYLRHGWREARDPNSLFDVSFYRDKTGCAVEPLQHYLKQGRAEGYRPGPAFDPARYLEANPDVAESGLDPLLHYLENGQVEGRSLPGDMNSGRWEEIGRSGFRILMVSHGLGGGTDRHCRDMEALLAEEGADVWMLESAADGLYRLSNGRRGISVTHDLTASVAETRLLADLRGLAPDLVHIHHVIGFGWRLERWLADLGAPYDVTLHDYTSICPRVTLIDDRHRYCREPADLGQCDRCVAADGAHPYLQRAYTEVGTTSRWRATFRGFLAGARVRFVPDRDVAERLARHFPGLSFEVRPHPEAVFPIPARRPPGGSRVRVAVIGGIGVHKGFYLLAACARAAQKEGLPLTFVVIGDVSAPEELADLPTVELSGRYRREELPGMIERSGCRVALFLSQWPETYMYTLSEALRAGLHPVVFDLGAPARRLRELGWGTILPQETRSEEINRRLLSLATDHPLPSPDLRVGQVYPSMLADYYGLERV